MLKGMKSVKRKNIPNRLIKLEPMDRPTTSHSGSRDSGENRNSISANMSMSKIIDIGEMNKSPFEQVKEQLDLAANPIDLEDALLSFAQAAQGIIDTTGLSKADIDVYNQMSPKFSAMIDSKDVENGKPLDKSVRITSATFIHMFEGLRIISNNISNILRPATRTSARTPNIVTPVHGNVGIKAVLPPIKPACPATERKPETPRKNDSPVEHFQGIMARDLFRISTREENDSFFLSSDIPDVLIDLILPDKPVKVRTYAAKAIKNATNNEKFRKLIVSLPNFDAVYTLLSYQDKNFNAIWDVASGIFRNLMIEKENHEQFIKNNLHIHLMTFLLKNVGLNDPIIRSIATNCFSVLNKVSGFDDIRASLLENFTPHQLVTIFLYYMKITDKSALVQRLAYVYADFASYEDSILEESAKITDPVDVAILTDKLAADFLAKDDLALAYILQVIANLSVDKECSQILSLSDNIPPLFARFKYGANERAGLNLLCVAANFTSHDPMWCPKELIDALPVAIVSKNLQSIIEALRALCNLALAPNDIIISSKLPELLIILIRHPSSEVVCYALQTLTNLVPQGGVRRRFREAKGVEAVLEALDVDEIDEAVLEAAAKLIMNYGAISSEEASLFIEKLSEFDCSGVDIVDVFKDFLRKQTLVSV
ncbi:hypothetical protein TVAG_266930 [Trichomonas vaginalis G3]|uniref:Armadillo/beta-catenin-like repeat family protein n=1 Tax=Trichomonas vaginalis (strain ATCC PRA-98 / G3) TaxID=412133 RepID=A2DQP6_TRIV3|nr:armadillo repeat containing 2 protein family [Trichomonas vaginalis G3]EAY17330.1 hypothetical protein TVAG_266930 [Trichomonas vaginalis G3]KAI5523179.1 armadillo repeat containing 2 protein family [Trichomonas vaginalis G3]|eukprot:XP_001329553.1 hypothetical protein [Trichomonas vaginalis G3]